MTADVDGLRIERQGDNETIALVRLERPERRNAIDKSSAVALTEFLEGATLDRGVRAIVITGSGRAPDLPPGTRITRAYNSIYVIDHDGSVLSIYDKLHLVPFGEYLPFQDWMEKLGFVQLTKVQGGFIPGGKE